MGNENIKLKQPISIVSSTSPRIEDLFGNNMYQRNKYNYGFLKDAVQTTDKYNGSDLNIESVVDMINMKYGSTSHK